MQQYKKCTRNVWRIWLTGRWAAAALSAAQKCGRLADVGRAVLLAEQYLLMAATEQVLSMCNMSVCVCVYLIVWLSIVCSHVYNYRIDVYCCDEMLDALHLPSDNWARRLTRDSGHNRTRCSMCVRCNDCYWRDGEWCNSSSSRKCTP